jgi:hypothetical protein
MRKPFSELAVGALFIHNGYVCLKLTTRTALFVQFGRTFYFYKTDMVEVNYEN